MKRLLAGEGRPLRSYIYVSGALLAAFAVWRAPSQEPAVDLVVERPMATRAASKGSSSSASLSMPTRTRAAPAAVNLFAAHSWYIPPPPPPPRPAAPIQPTAPPVPYAWLGSYTPEGGPTIFFLSRDDRVFDVQVGDQIENTYSVDAQLNGQLQLTYLPLNTRQTVLLGGAGSSGANQ